MAINAWDWDKQRGDEPAFSMDSSGNLMDPSTDVSLIFGSTKLYASSLFHSPNVYRNAGMQVQTGKPEHPVYNCCPSK